MPGSVPELNRKDIRELIIANYRIIYRIETRVISILTVKHSRQILPEEDIEHVKTAYSNLCVYALSDEDLYYEKKGYKKAGSIFQI